jgi:phosphoserine phosphatase
MKKIAFFDFCGTVMSTNNTYDFLFYYFSKKKRYFKLLTFFVLDCLSDFLFFFPENLRRQLEIFFIRKRVFYLLKNEKKKDIDRIANNFLEEAIKKGYINQKIIQEISKKRKEGYKIYLLSSSIDSVLNAFKKKFKIDNVLSSKIKYDKNNIASGLVDDYLYRKKDLIQKINKNILKKSIFYSDNKEDLLLKDKFRKFIFIKSLKKKTSKSYSFTITNKNFLFTYIPSFYYLLSRPLALIYFFLNEALIFFIGFGFKTQILMSYFLYLLLFLPIYEIGSLYNDYFSVKKENNPTLRIQNGLHYDFLVFVLIRIFYGTLIFYFIKDAMLFLLISIFILILSFFHSNIKEEKRIYTMVILRVLKLIPFYLLVKDEVAFFIFIFLVMAIQINPIILYFFDKLKNFSFFFVKIVFIVTFFFFSLLSLFIGVNTLITVFFIFTLRYLSFKNYLRKI